MRLTIHDIAGRQVAAIHDGRAPVGTHVPVWDGRTREGHRVAAGVYFVRLAHREEVLVRKIVVLR